MKHNKFNLLYLFIALLFIQIKTEEIIINSKGFLGEHTKCQNMKDNSPVFTIYLKGDFSGMANYVEEEKCFFPHNTFSISSTLTNETDETFPLICSYIKYKNITHYQLNCVLINFNSNYVGPFRMTKLSHPVSSTSSKAAETDDNYIVNLIEFDDDTVFGHTQKNILRDLYLVGFNKGNKVIIDYAKTDNKIFISYVGEVTKDNLPKVESSGHILNCEPDYSIKSWEICYINKDDFPINNNYTLIIYDQCNLPYDYHPNFYTTQSSNNQNYINYFEFSTKVVGIFIALILF